MRTHLNTKVFGNTAAFVVSDAISPTGGAYIYMWCLTRSGAAHSHTPSDSFGGLTWTHYTIQGTSGSTRIRLSFAWALLPATPGTHTVQMDFDGNVGRRILSVWLADSLDAAVPFRQNISGSGTTATTPLLTLPSAPIAANEVVAAFGVYFPTGGATDIAPGTSDDDFTQDREDSTAVGSADLGLMQEFRTGSASPTVDAETMGTSINVGLAVELNSGVPADPPDAPTALAATVNGAESVTLDWTDNADNEDAQIIRRAPDVILTGTVTSDGSADVVGVGTLATTQLAVDQYIRIGALTGTFRVTSITDNTHFAVTPSPAAQSGVAYSTAGTFATIDEIAADLETYDDDTVAQQTRYWYRVRATNADGDSDPSNDVQVLTRSLPVLTRVTPASGTVSLPVLGLGLTLPFEVGATDNDDGALSGASVEWLLNGNPTPIGTDVTHLLDIDAELITAGSHILEAIATDSDGDESNPMVWTITLSAPGADTRITTEGPLFDTPVLFGAAVRIRGLKFRGPDGNFVNPTFEEGDVKAVKDGTDIDNAAFLPILQVRNEHYFDIDAAESNGQQTIYTFKDLDDPPEWVPVTGRILTYGDPSAFYSEPLQQLGTDDRALVSADAHVSGLTVEALDSAERDAVASALLGLTAGIETNLTLRQAIRLLLAAAVGLSQNVAAGTPEFLRVQPDGAGLLSDAAPVAISGTADDGDRSGITVTPG